MQSDGSTKIPSDQVNLKIILVSGETSEFLFNPEDSVSVITQHIFDNWPDAWPSESKPEENIIRLIYQGRFLHDSVSLAALQLARGKTTVMHLVCRESLPAANHPGNIRRGKPHRASSTRQHETGCCASCTLL
ncbi:UBL3 [Bugula neritina]|uniref:UBL3 n=1 Tax=Bugula neritina TaxID=10212 RepID=A0A7J7IRK5_BUGNE|nr:UBL3 [Bugula neritina]